MYTNETQEKYFDLEGKNLKLIQALDRDLNDISSLQLSASIFFFKLKNYEYLYMLYHSSEIGGLCLMKYVPVKCFKICHAFGIQKPM